MYSCIRCGSTLEICTGDLCDNCSSSWMKQKKPKNINPLLMNIIELIQSMKKERRGLNCGNMEVRNYNKALDDVLRRLKNG